MAIVTTGATTPLWMQDDRVDVLSFDGVGTPNPLGTLDPGFALVSQSATQIVITTDRGTTQTYTGSFLFDASGNFIHSRDTVFNQVVAANGQVTPAHTDTAYSTLTSVVETAGATVIFSITGITGTFSRTVNVNGEGSLLGGNDALTGSPDNDILWSYGGADTLNGGLGADAMYGGSGSDVYIVDNAGDRAWDDGGPGTDRVDSSVNFNLAGNNASSIENLTLTGTAISGTGDGNNNVLIGNAANNVLTGNFGNDTLDGGAGADTMVGGNGNDTYVVDNVGDVITENQFEGDDTVRSSITYTLADKPNLENITLTGTGTINATGNTSFNILTGNSAANVLDGGAYGSNGDTFFGGLGNDTYIVDEDDDSVWETSAGGGTDTVLSSVSFDMSGDDDYGGGLSGQVAYGYGFIENLTLTGTGNIEAYGNNLNNVITGNSGNNHIDGYGGADTMAGGLGNDTYWVDNAGDVVTEAANAGVDTVIVGGNNTTFVTTSYSLNTAGSLNVENLLDYGSANINLTGNALNNEIDGGEGNNVLDGGVGADVMYGGEGDDVYIVDNAGDHAADYGGGTDRVESAVTFFLTQGHNQGYGSLENLTLTGTAAIDGFGTTGNNVLIGNTAANTLVGYGGNDTLDGGAGADVMFGGGDDFTDDTYVVDVAGDVIIETPNGGSNDTVRSAVTFSLVGTNLEHVTLTGIAANNATGNAGNNELTGNDGANVLDGGAGIDVMYGGLGNDTYIVDTSGIHGGNRDEVHEVGVGGGVDTVLSSVSFDMGGRDKHNTAVGYGFIENLTLTGTGNTTAYGNDLNNLIIGNSGNNDIDGYGGADTMIGGAGDDFYSVDHAGDVVTEAAAAGTDSIESAISFNMTTHAGAVNVENLILTGSANINGTGNALSNVISGNFGNNVLDGGAGADALSDSGGGNDVYIVDNVADVVNESIGGTDRVESSVTFALDSANELENLTLTGAAAIDGAGNALNNILIGNTAANVLTGGDGDDRLDGGTGADTLIGGAGGDDYVVADAGDVIVEAFNEGFDEVFSSVNFSLEDTFLESLTLTGTAAINATGNTENNNLYGNSGANVLDGGAGADFMAGYGGNDTYVVDDVEDSVQEQTGGATGGVDTVQSSITFWLNGSQFLENLTLTGASDIDGYGNAQNNVLTGNGGANELDGYGGADTMIGGLGDDSYRVDNAGDVVTETTGTGGGTDAIESSISFNMTTHVGANNVENLILTGNANINATGNSQNNFLEGNSGNNILDGGTVLSSSADTMSGGDGNDTYAVDHANDVVVEAAGAGTDTVITSTATYTLGDNFENLTLGAASTAGTGNALANVLTAGNVAGIETLTGLGGNDTYVVNTTTDVVVEGVGADIDLVKSSVTYTITDADVENLTLTGTGNINGTGNSGINTLTGNSGNNILDGGTGVDNMVGGLGDDIYIVDDLGDIVTDIGAGVDTVNSSVTFSIFPSAGVENLTLTGIANNNATGNTLNNILTGNSGDNILDGGAGADRMVGLAGADSYTVDNIGDVVVEATANAGADTVTSSVSFSLNTANAAGAENLTLFAGVTNISATGNALGNTLTGNAGNNTLDGKGGVDTMVGGDGNDTYIVDSTTDVVTEGVGGNDTVLSSVNFTINTAGGAEVENLLLTGAGAITGTGNTLSNFLAGNRANNTLIGNDGNDTIDGRQGADTMIGGEDGDTYVVDNSGDVVTELGVGGTDTIQSSISFNLATGGLNIENLILTGNRNIDGSGTGSANSITGNSGNNVLSGGGGIDTLTGNDGNDILIYDATDTSVNGGNGTDTLRFDGAGQTLDLATTLNSYTGIEKVNLTGIGANTLVVTLQEVLDLSDTNTLQVLGNAGDIIDDTADTWTLVSEVAIRGQVYNEYQATNINGTATLLVDTDLTQTGLTT